MKRFALFTTRFHTSPSTKHLVHIHVLLPLIFYSLLPLGTRSTLGHTRRTPSNVKPTLPRSTHTVLSTVTLFLYSIVHTFICILRISNLITHAISILCDLCSIQNLQISTLFSYIFNFFIFYERLRDSTRRFLDGNELCLRRVITFPFGELTTWCTTLRLHQLT